ncbi:FtsX-like permease family protein [bacterium]|nr:FtsX-like permease family protein [bacterium]
MSEGGHVSPREALRQAMHTVRGHRLRSWLLILGVAIGVATLLAIVTIVSGLSDRIRQDIVSASRPYLYVARYTGLGGEDVDAKLRRRQLDPELLPLVADVEGVERVDYMVQNHTATVLKYDKERTGAVQVFGASENFPYMYSYDVGEGRFFNRQELQARERVCVLGYGPASDLFPILDPIGRTLNIRGRPYRIIGTMAERKSIMGSLGENYVVVPWTTYEKDFLDRGMEDRSIAATVAPGYSLEEVRSDLTGALRAGRRLRPSEPDDFDINTSETYGEMVDGITGAIAIVLTVLASIGLLVGGIGVMNIMLISVTERTKEIGVRMALGARRRDVLLQVLLEAGSLTLVGGVVGIVLGYVLSYAMTQVLAFPFRVDPLTTLVAVVVSAGIGVVCGVYPANRAAGLDPVEALRSE